MGKPAKLSDEQLEYLRKNADRPCSVLATHIGVCVDTLKRILVRHDIRHFDGAKYVAARREAYWSRPCMVCGNTYPRPRNQYRCDACHKEAAPDHGLPDDFHAY